MANNKVQLADGTTLIDLTEDTVTAEDMVSGVTAHGANGEQIVGTLDINTIKKGLIYYGACDTGAATQAKVVTIDGINEYYTGLHVRILFTNNQTYNGVPTLNINSLGAKNIRRVSGTNSGRYEWLAGEVLDLVYNGTYFVLIDGSIATTAYYGVTKLYTGAGSTATNIALTPASLHNFANGSVAPYYSASITYAVGDTVRYGNNLYKCNTAIDSAEAWNAEHWTLLDPLLEQIEAIQTSIPSAGANTPLADSGDGSVGSSIKYAREDHVHPTFVHMKLYTEVSQLNLSGTPTLSAVAQAMPNESMFMADVSAVDLAGIPSAISAAKYTGIILVVRILSYRIFSVFFKTHDNIAFTNSYFLYSAYNFSTKQFSGFRRLPFYNTDSDSLPIENGGTGATNASDALTNLGLDDTGWVKLTIASGFKAYSDDDGNMPRYRRIGKIVMVKGVITPTATTSTSSSEITIASGLPANARPVDNVTMLCQGSGKNSWLFGIKSNGNLTLGRYGTTGFSDISTGTWLPFSATFIAG